MDEKYKRCDENKHDWSNMYFPFISLTVQLYFLF